MVNRIRHLSCTRPWVWFPKRRKNKMKGWERLRSCRNDVKIPVYLLSKFAKFCPISNHYVCSMIHFIVFSSYAYAYNLFSDMVEGKSQYNNDQLHTMLQCMFLNKQEYTHKPTVATSQLREFVQLCFGD